MHRQLCRAAVAALMLVSAGASSCAMVHTAAKATPRAHGPLYQMTRALRIGVKPDQPGIGLANSAFTQWSGLDVDIALAVAAALHDKPVFQPVVSSNRESMLSSHAVDLVIASYSISAVRLKMFDFAGPYLIAGQDVLVRSGDTRIAGVDDLRDKVTCGAQGSDSPRRVALRFGGNDAMNDAWSRRHLVLVSGYGDCLPLLLNGQADAVSTDDSILAGFANDPRYKGRVRVLGKRFTDHVEEYGIALDKGDAADVALINATLIQMLKDGSWEGIVRRNLGDFAPLFLKPADRPVPRTAQ